MLLQSWYPCTFPSTFSWTFRGWKQFVFALFRKLFVFIHEDLPKHELCLPKIAKLSCKGLSAVFAARQPSDEKGRIESKFFKKHQNDAAYRHRGQILVTLMVSCYTTPIYRNSIGNNQTKTKTKRKSVRTAQYVQRWQPLANVRNFEENTIVQQNKQNNFSIS